MTAPHVSVDGPQGPIAPPRWQRLSPRVRWVWFGERAAVAVAVTAGVAVMMLLPPVRLLAPGLRLAVVGVTAVMLLGHALGYALLAYRCYRYAVREHDVLIDHGIVWQTRRSVPRFRVQHIDLTVGPTERWLGVASLKLFTAGTGGADVEIPGLPHDAAVALRDRLLQEDWSRG